MTRLAAIVVNHGRFTITSVDAQFSFSGDDLIPPHRSERISGFGNVHEALQPGWNASPENAMRGVLTPWDVGIRFETDDVHVNKIPSPYPVVQWTASGAGDGNIAAATYGSSNRVKDGPWMESAG